MAALALAACGVEAPATVDVQASATPAAAAGIDAPPAGAAFVLTAPGMAEGEEIPGQYTCDGADVSPALAWTGVPAGARSLVVWMDDPDAAGFVHWLVYDIPASVEGLDAAMPVDAEGVSAIRQGLNSFGAIGYGGPCPPSGTHQYIFRLMALDRALDLGAGADADALVDAMQGHVLGEASLRRSYTRP
jgi:hypothetical protein